MPEPFTLRQLLKMRDAKMCEFWQPFSILIALTYNANKGKNKKVLKSEDVNPYLKKEVVKQEVVRDNAMFLDAMKALFVKEKKK